MSLPSGEVELVETSHKDGTSSAITRSVASLRGSGISGNLIVTPTVMDFQLGLSLPSGEVELVETAQLLGI